MFYEFLHIIFTLDDVFWMLLVNIKVPFSRLIITFIYVMMCTTSCETFTYESFQNIQEAFSGSWILSNHYTDDSKCTTVFCRKCKISDGKNIPFVNLAQSGYNCNPCGDFDVVGQGSLWAPWPLSKLLYHALWPAFSFHLLTPANYIIKETIMYFFLKTFTSYWNSFIPNLTYYTNFTLRFHISVHWESGTCLTIIHLKRKCCKDMWFADLC